MLSNRDAIRFGAVSRLTRNAMKRVRVPPPPPCILDDGTASRPKLVLHSRRRPMPGYEGKVHDYQGERGVERVYTRIPTRWQAKLSTKDAILKRLLLLIDRRVANTNTFLLVRRLKMAYGGIQLMCGPPANEGVLAQLRELIGILGRNPTDRYVISSTGPFVAWLRRSSYAACYIAMYLVGFR